MRTYGVGCLEEKSSEKAEEKVTVFLVEKKWAKKGEKHSKIWFRESVAHVIPQVQITDLFYKA